jgi:transmembrane sensor
METRVSRVRAYADRVREAQHPLLSAPSAAIDAARARWIACDEAPVSIPRTTYWPRGRDVPHGRPWRAAGMGVAAAALAVAAIALFWPRAPAPLSFEVETQEASAQGRTEPGALGRWIASPPTARMPVRFSDGSLISIEPASRARVVDVATNGASVVLESGAAEVNVVHREKTRWSVRAGPFEVAVTGTAFKVAWDPVAEVFTLTMEQGRVTVSGCSLPAGRVMGSGEAFRVACHEGRFVVPDGASSPAPPAPEGNRNGKSEPLAPRLTASSASPSARFGGPVLSPTGVVPSPGSSTRHMEDLIGSGRYAEAVDAADAEGLAEVCTEVSIQDLVSLGDAARFSGRADEADYVLQRLRERFPRDERASVAAFNLGRIAFDIRRSYADAARWFETYLNERPSGPLAREASGRVMEALERSGSHQRAREAAARYLQAFPSGPHADLARSITAGE